ncbi:phosphatase PAP2 family protein [Patulibacter sp. NPDC049589]|uniref:phosphatase PAP2 family protein n=1 Tax=Patulibacter sp. NPDC049589 TaxID=3154731 RepID=UPI003433537C
MDQQLLETLNAFLVQHHDVRVPVVDFVVSAQVAIAILVIGLFVLGRRATRRGAFLAGCSAATGVLAAQGITALVDRARPFVADPVIQVMVHHGPDRSFPSDSATGAFAIAVALYAYAPRWGRAILVLAGLLAVGRVAVGMHYPTDVLTGAVLGALTAIVLRAAPIRTRLERLADELSRVASLGWAGDRRRPVRPAGTA